MRGPLVDAIQRAQVAFRAAGQEHRLLKDEASRNALDKARRELDELQRIAAHSVVEVVRR